MTDTSAIGSSLLPFLLLRMWYAIRFNHVLILCVPAHAYANMDMRVV
ncbi:hypothetical protein [Orrella marina]|nr:hypothetical protein [Orrella marina]